MYMSVQRRAICWLVQESYLNGQQLVAVCVRNRLGHAVLGALRGKQHCCLPYCRVSRTECNIALLSRKMHCMFTTTGLRSWHCKVNVEMSEHILTSCFLRTVRKQPCCLQTASGQLDVI